MEFLNSSVVVTINNKSIHETWVVTVRNEIPVVPSGLSVYELYYGSKHKSNWALNIFSGPTHTECIR